MSDQYVSQWYQKHLKKKKSSNFTVLIRLGQRPPNFFFRELLLTSNIITDTHILANVMVVGPNDRNPKLKIYISELSFDSYEYIPVAYVTVYCMILP